MKSRKNWSGRRDLNSGPPAPKPAGLSFGSPSFSILFLQINELDKYLVVARCTEVWPCTHRVPPISPSAKKQRNSFIDARLLRNTNPSVESRKRVALFGSIWIVGVVLSRQCHREESQSHRKIGAAFQKLTTTVQGTVDLVPQRSVQPLISGVQRCLKPLFDSTSTNS